MEGAGTPVYGGSPVRRMLVLSYGGAGAGAMRTDTPVCMGSATCWGAHSHDLQTLTCTHAPMPMPHAQDIYSLFHLNRPFKFISKTSNFLIPIIGWSMFLTGA